MLKKAAIALIASAVLVTSAGVALAEPVAPTSPSDTAKQEGKKTLGTAVLHRSLHAEWVSKGKDGTFVTHQAIKGSVVAASATSIQVKAEDGVAQTYVVNADTKVRLRTDGKGAEATMAQVKVGAKALVVGTGTTTLTATGVIIQG